MTWAEYKIRLHAYNRMDWYDWIKVREIAWASLVSFHQSHKNIPKSKNEFIKLDKKEDKNGISDLMKERILRAKEEYKKAIKAKQNG